MIQRGDGLGFALKTLRELFPGNFDRDVAIQARIAPLPDLAHSTGADGRQDFIRAEFVAWLERHMIDLTSVLGQKSELRLNYGVSVPYIFKTRVWRRVEVPAEK